MANNLTKDEKFVRDELTKVYPQLQKNMYKVCGDAHWRWGDDLLAVAVTFFLEKPLETQLKTINNGKLENFITWIANMQLKSSSSYFYTRYRRPMGSSRELYPELDYNDKIITYENKEELYQCVNVQLSKIPEDYRDHILSLLYKERTMTEILKGLDIGSITFKKNINDYLKKIEEECQHCI